MRHAWATSKLQTDCKKQTDKKFTFTNNLTKRKMATKQFNIETGKVKSLAEFSDNKIVIRKIKVIKGDIHDLFTPIQVKTTLPTGEIYSYYIHATSFHSLTKLPQNETNEQMEVVVRNCKYTELLITSMQGKEATLGIEYTTIEGEPLIVVVSQDSDGYTFTLTTSSKEIILSKFPAARPVRSVVVGYDVRQDFEMMYSKIENHILPALTDLTEEQLNQLGQVSLVDAQTKTIIKSI